MLPFRAGARQRPGGGRGWSGRGWTSRPPRRRPGRPL